MKTDELIKKLFADEPCNTDRQTEIDIVKLILIFDLVFCHCFLTCCSDERLSTGLPYFMDTIWGGPLGADGFMMAMGVCMVYTRHGTPHRFAQRGIKLAVLGLLLNICRCTIPYLIGYALTGDYDKYMSTIVFETFENDILMFAGLSFLLMALLIQLKLRPFAILVLSLIMSGIATMLNGIDLHSVPANIIAGHFIGTEDAPGQVHSYFTLLNWFAIPAFGNLYGYFYIRLKDKNTFHLITGIPALLLANLYLISGVISRRGIFGDGELCYYHIGFFDIIGVMICTVAFYAVAFWLSLIVPESIRSLAVNAGKHLTSVYFIQWIIIRVTVDIVLYNLRGSTELADWQIILLALFILMLTVAVSACFQKLRRKVIQSNG